MKAKEMKGHVPTSLRGLKIYAHLYKSRYKKDREEFGRLFFVGLPFKRVKWHYGKYGQINGDKFTARTQRGRQQFCRMVCKKYPNVFTKSAQKYYLAK